MTGSKILFYGFEEIKCFLDYFIACFAKVALINERFVLLNALRSSLIQPDCEFCHV